MKLHFEPNLDFQLNAVNSVCDLFRGQEICRSEFSLARDWLATQNQLGISESGLGIGNQLSLNDDQILTNLKEVQLRNGLPPSDSISSGDFTVEMETGTGKTYVYIRTIFELNKRYGFTKYVIVVPSLAIKEGVYKSIQMTDDHFRSLYSGTPFEFFVYDSARLGQVRNFATSQQIQIMIVTVGAINKKDINNLYKNSERTGGEKPIDLIRATQPILIVDEPQSVDGGLAGRGKEALLKMNPLCTLRYSATHVDRYHMVYRLDAVDAFQRQLVKQIEVASATVEDAHNKPYIRLLSVNRKRGAISARVELDVESSGHVRRVERTVQDGYDLEHETRRAVYSNCRIGEISAERSNTFLELLVPGGEHYLKTGEAWGDIDTLALQREMIRRTIREHLDKEKRFRPLGVKVLSLFFIDAVQRYRRIDKDGSLTKGVYAQLFEEEYRRLSNHPNYRSQISANDLETEVEAVHGGYFSIDRAGTWTDTAENNQSNRENAERAYNLIMREKERILNLQEPLRFIFSHSALREGWDNPNVFQICSLRNIQTERERRQTIGRGLRLCVNQKGERLRGFEVNTLTVIANESYENFAFNLQREIERDTGIRFGVVQAHQFSAIHTVGKDGRAETLGFEKSLAINRFLQKSSYIDSEGRIQDSLRVAIRDEKFVLPNEFAAEKSMIISVLLKLAGRLEIKNADDRQSIRRRQAVLESTEFKALWDRIKYKTTYRISFNNKDLIEECATKLNNAPPLPRTRLQWSKASIVIGQSGLEASDTADSAPITITEKDIKLPDLLTELQNRTQLTRKSIHKILVLSQRLDDFVHNPQMFIDLATQAINRCKRKALVDGIKYQRVGDESYYAQELFLQEELTGYLKNMLEAKKSVYDKVIYEAKNEARFADQLEKNTAVKVYAKLPRWFTVPTPLGSYNPDWAVVIETDDSENLYFVVETKGSMNYEDLRLNEAAKIECGRAHFEALKVTTDPARYEVASSIDDLLVHTGHS